MPYYCWRVCVVYACGCRQQPNSFAHTCNRSVDNDCSAWTTYKYTTRNCEAHRDAVMLHGDNTTAADTTSLLDVSQDTPSRDYHPTRRQGLSGDAQQEQQQSEEFCTEGQQQQGCWEGQYLRRRA
ncbi:hypothetical protein QBC35DRAFT_9274 [Podospora australis]|uniref:Uncharacterized protein n=1 Tax=Podospora australis TaxID=1536484 RepID=A0AAN6X6G1_9PEZI|nr:hypothetical protein QBC35DRAFT_9274 [Podospora australis]